MHRQFSKTICQMDKRMNEYNEEAGCFQVPGREPMMLLERGAYLVKMQSSASTSAMAFANKTQIDTQSFLLPPVSWDYLCLLPTTIDGDYSCLKVRLHFFKNAP